MSFIFMKKSKSQIMKERWATPGYKDRQSLRLRKEWRDTEKRSKRLIAQAEAYKKPETNTGGSFRNSAAANHARKFVNPENLIAANRRNAELRIGVAIKSGPGMKGPENHTSIYWKVRSPSGFVIEGRNLNHLVREHAVLFDPQDVTWKGANCRATKGLRSLFERNGKSVSWKGWTAIANWHPSDDPLNRRVYLSNLPITCCDELS